MFILATGSTMTLQKDLNLMERKTIVYNYMRGIFFPTVGCKNSGVQRQDELTDRPHPQGNSGGLKSAAWTQAPRNLINSASPMASSRAFIGR